MCMHVPVETREGNQVPWACMHRWFWAPSMYAGRNKMIPSPSYLSRPNVSIFICFKIVCHFFSFIFSPQFPFSFSSLSPPPCSSLLSLFLRKIQICYRIHSGHRICDSSGFGNEMWVFKLIRKTLYCWANIPALSSIWVNFFLALCHFKTLIITLSIFPFNTSFKFLYFSSFFFCPALVFVLLCFEKTMFQFASSL